MGFDAGDMPLQCSLKELLAFFTVVASSQISPHTQRAWLALRDIRYKGNLFFAYFVRYKPFFSYSSCFLTKSSSAIPVPLFSLSNMAMLLFLMG